MAMKDSQQNSVRNLEYLYSTVVGLGLSLAIYNLIDTDKIIPFRLELLPFFFSFLITLIPFYHGALRHLDITYIEKGGKQVRKGALMADFFLLFLESCLLLALGILLIKPAFFVWGLVALLGIDTIWGFTAYLAFTQEDKSKPELRWAIINLFATIILIIFLFIADFIHPTNYEGKMWVFILCVSFVRTIMITGGVGIPITLHLNLLTELT